MNLLDLQIELNYELKILKRQTIKQNSDMDYLLIVDYKGFTGITWMTRTMREEIKRL